MAGLLHYSLPILIILSASLSPPAYAQSSEEAKSKEEEESVTTAGFLLYRLANDSDSESVQYLLLKSADGDVWNPPMVNVEGTESQLQAAYRIAKEETGFVPNIDYLAFTESQEQVYFQFEKEEILNRVHLWPARMINFNKPVQLNSAKHSEHAWLDYQEANEQINGQYRTGLSLGNGIIRARLAKGIAYYYKSSQNFPELSVVTGIKNNQPVLVEFEP